MDLIGLDKEVFLYLNNLGNNSWDFFWLTITDKLNWIPLYIIFTFLIFKKFGIKKLLIILVVVALMIATSDQISLLYKNTLILRLRPCFNPDFEGIMRVVKGSCGGKYGFFSGHATNHFALAVFLSLLFRKKYLSIILIIWAGFIAYSRVYIGVHYPLDILTGSFIGSLIGYLYYEIYQALLHSRLCSRLLSK